MTRLNGDEGDEYDFGGGLRAAVVPLGGSVVVIGWTALVDEAPQLVELTLGEKSSVGTADALGRKAEELRKRLDGGWRPDPLTKPHVVNVASSLVEGAARPAPSPRVPMQRHVRIASVERSTELAKRLAAEEALVAPYANDALLVATLMARGDRAPAKTLAEARGISVRSAQGRIARARKYGLLTPVPHGVIAGEATELTIRIVKAALKVAKENAGRAPELGEESRG